MADWTFWLDFFAPFACQTFQRSTVILLLFIASFSMAAILLYFQRTRTNGTVVYNLQTLDKEGNQARRPITGRPTYRMSPTPSTSEAPGFFPPNSPVLHFQRNNSSAQVPLPSSTENTSMLPPPIPFAVVKETENENKQDTVTDTLDTPADNVNEQDTVTDTVDTPSDNVNEPGTVTETMDTPRENDNETGIVTETAHTPPENDNERDTVKDTVNTPPDNDSEPGTVTETMDTPSSDTVTDNTDYDSQTSREMDTSDDTDNLMIIECIRCGAEYLHSCYAPSSNNSDVDSYIIQTDNISVDLENV